MELKRIRLEDVYPDDANPRSKESMGDIAALADSFRLNAINPGEPVNPVVVVADGGIYRIVDGERRYRAMRLLKKADCMAVVCEGMDEANAMLAMLATDDKERLTDAERSRGVQQMLLLGVDPEKVERAGRMSKGSADRVRRAMAKVDDAAQDMTLDRLLAIEEVGDDPDAVSRLEGCPEKEWRRVYDGIMRERESAAKAAELEAAALLTGLPVEEERPDGLRYARRTDDPGAIAAMAEEAPDGSAFVVSATSWSAYAELYVPADEEADREAAETARRADGLREAAKDGALRRKRWFAGHIEAGTYDRLSVAAALMDRARERRKGDYYAMEFADWIAEFCGEAGIDDIPVYATPFMAAYAYQRYARALGEHPSVRHDATVGADDAGAWLDWLGMCVEDGYEPDEADGLLQAACVAAFDENEEDQEG